MADSWHESCIQAEIQKESQYPNSRFMHSKSRFKIAIALCAILLAGGTLGYMLIDGYPLLDGFYMTLITITTVGFGEIRPLSEAGRIFTSFLILFGFGVLAFAGHTAVESLLENVWGGERERKRMKKKITRLKNHYVICGYGRMGAAAADHFKKNNFPFVIIDPNAHEITQIQDNGYLFVAGDATAESTLLEAGIKRAKGLLAVLGSDPQNLFIVLTARELNPTLHIISRAEESSSEAKILRAGADSVVSPFSTAGKLIASNVLASLHSKGAAECVLSPSPTPILRWIHMEDHSDLVGRTIKELEGQIRGKVVGCRRNGNDIIEPAPDMPLTAQDKVLALIQSPDGEPPFKKEPEQRLVIVDDNPVILSLYTRLFKRAGFNPITAKDGREGVEVIKKERPSAAVIDFMLPVLSGIDVCRLVRQDPSCSHTRLILFTSDDQPETKERALEAGANEVIIKSPEASEVVETVVRLLRSEG